MFATPKAADLKELVQGGQVYRTFPFSKGSLVTDLLRLLLVRFNGSRVTRRLWENRPNFSQSSQNSRQAKNLHQSSI
jgi:hypothetical protein